MHSHDGGDEPCEAYEAVIDVYQAEIGCWYPDVQDVDDELVARIRTHLFESKLSRLALCHVTEIFLGPGFGGTQLPSLLGKAAGLEQTMCNAQ